MKKVALFAMVLALVSGSASAADMALKAPKAPAPFDPWDIAFGAGVMNDYIFRGVTQSNHQASVTGYFEPRYNVNKDLQLYIGTSVESLSSANRAAAEVDIYGGVRPTFGSFALDFGVWGYLYPGGHCADGTTLTGGIPGGGVWPVSTDTFFIDNANVMNNALSLLEVFPKWLNSINKYTGFGKVPSNVPMVLN